MEILKKNWSNFEIDLGPLKFSPENLRPLFFLSENLRPLKKHSGRVFPIYNVHPLTTIPSGQKHPSTHFTGRSLLAPHLFPHVRGLTGPHALYSSHVSHWIAVRRERPYTFKTSETFISDIKIPDTVVFRTKTWGGRNLNRPNFFFWLYLIDELKRGYFFLKKNSIHTNVNII